MMSTIALAAFIPIALVALILILLPDRKTISRERLVPAPAAPILDLVASNEGYQSFNPFKDKDPNLKLEMFGPDHGVGSGFTFSGKDGKGSQTVAAVVPNESVTLQLDLGPLGRPVTTFMFEPEDSGTRVRWTTTAQFGLNPIARVFGLFLERILGPEYEHGLDLLANHFTR